MTNDECPNCGPDCATTRGHRHTLELAPGNDDCCPCCAYLPKVMTPAVLVNGATSPGVTEVDRLNTVIQRAIKQLDRADTAEDASDLYELAVDARKILEGVS